MLMFKENDTSLSKDEDECDKNVVTVNTHSISRTSLHDSNVKWGNLTINSTMKNVKLLLFAIVLILFFVEMSYIFIKSFQLGEVGLKHTLKNTNTTKLLEMLKHQASKDINLITTAL